MSMNNMRRMKKMETDYDRALKVLGEIAEEIRVKFDCWDNNIKAGQQPVPIQDLDYWSFEIYKAVKVIRMSRRDEE
jgi:hypothetical protein